MRRLQRFWPLREVAMARGPLPKPHLGVPTDEGTAQIFSIRAPSQNETYVFDNGLNHRVHCGGALRGRQCTPFAQSRIRAWRTVLSGRRRGPTRVLLSSIAQRKARVDPLRTFRCANAAIEETHNSHSCQTHD